MTRLFAAVAATTTERHEVRPGDDVAAADVVMDRAFTVPASPATVWPWLQQLGKRRAGWYLPTGLERLLPTARRAARDIDPRWQHLAVGDVVPDYGGRYETFTVVDIDPPHHLVYWSQRGRAQVTWSIVLRPDGDRTGHSRVLFRLRMGPVRRVWLAKTAGEAIDLITVAGLHAGLRNRLTRPERDTS